MKEIWCDNCQQFTPLQEGEPHSDRVTPYLWYELLCGQCHWIIATIRIVEAESEKADPS